MTTMLRIDASAQQQDRSLTRMLSKLFTTELLHAKPTFAFDCMNGR